MAKKPPEAVGGAVAITGVMPVLGVVSGVSIMWPTDVTYLGGEYRNIRYRKWQGSRISTNPALNWRGLKLGKVSDLTQGEREEAPWEIRDDDEVVYSPNQFDCEEERDALYEARPTRNPTDPIWQSEEEFLEKLRERTSRYSGDRAIRGEATIVIERSIYGDHITAVRLIAKEDSMFFGEPHRLAHRFSPNLGFFEKEKGGTSKYRYHWRDFDLTDCSQSWEYIPKAAIERLSSTSTIIED